MFCELPEQKDKPKQDSLKKAHPFVVPVLHLPALAVNALFVCPQNLGQVGERGQSQNGYCASPELVEPHKMQRGFSSHHRQAQCRLHCSFRHQTGSPGRKSKDMVPFDAACFMSAEVSASER